MKMNNLPVTILVCFLLILNTDYLSGQLSSRDSMILGKHKAVKLTDSLNSTVPTHVRRITIKFLTKNGLNPDEFYTIGQFKPIIILARGYDKVGILNILRINALRDLEDAVSYKEVDGVQTMTFRGFGAAGGLNDDLQIIFDAEYKKVLTMYHSE
jgi:hypothetical protein